MTHRTGRQSLNQWIYRLLRVALGAVFIWASWEKIADPAGFATIIDNYRILPQGWSGPLALLLPWIEAVCGVLLITGLLLNGSLVLVNAMLLVFFGALLSSYVRGIDIACGCFTNALTSARSIVYDMLRDVVFLAIGLWVMVFRLKMERRTASALNAQRHATRE
jgi:uncharacterized membrane protein YphA (DoxX/SURF4 family)